MLRARLVLLVGLGAALACNSDDTGAAPGSSSTGEPGSSSSGTTLAPTSTGDTSTGSSSTTVDPTTGDPTTGTPEPEQTCRDVLMCFTECAVSLDPACFQACTGNLPPEEGMKALALGACVVQGCFGSGACTVDTLQDPLCLACIGIGLLSNSTPGCEEQADACN